MVLLPFLCLGFKKSGQRVQGPKETRPLSLLTPIPSGQEHVYAGMDVILHVKFISNSGARGVHKSAQSFI